MRKLNIAACIVSVVTLPPIVLGLAVSGYLADGGEPTPAPIYACEFEDGHGQDSCYWDADSFGNGEGRSFVKVGDTYHYYCND
jgi:hypothetical protein